MRSPSVTSVCPEWRMRAPPDPSVVLKGCVSVCAPFSLGCRRPANSSVVRLPLR
jgi:hypothetical protein